MVQRQGAMLPGGRPFAIHGLSFAKCRRPGSNWRPLACEAKVITNYTTTTEIRGLRDPNGLSIVHTIRPHTHERGACGAWDPCRCCLLAQRAHRWLCVSLVAGRVVAGVAAQIGAHVHFTVTCLHMMRSLGLPTCCHASVLVRALLWHASLTVSDLFVVPVGGS